MSNASEVSEEPSNEQAPAPNRPLDEKGADVPRAAIYSELRDLWLAGPPARRNADLAALLDDVSEQAASQWATGTMKKQPPWWAILRLARALDREIRLTPDGWSLVRLRKAKGPKRGPRSKSAPETVPET
jgi:hypothetical protein